MERPVPGSPELPIQPLTRGLAARLAGLTTGQLIVGGLLAIAVLIALGYLVYWAANLKLPQQAKQPNLPPTAEPLPIPPPPKSPVVGGAGTLAEPTILGDIARSPIVFLAYSRHGRFLAVRSETREIRVWDVPTWKHQVLQADSRDQGPVSLDRPLAFTDDEKILAWRQDQGLGLNKIRSWDFTTGSEGQRWASMGGDRTQLAFEPGTHKLITSDSLAGARVHWFAADKENFTRAENRVGIQNLISPDGTRLVCLDSAQMQVALPGSPAVPAYSRLDLYDTTQLVPSPPNDQQKRMKCIVRLGELSEFRQNWGMLFSPDSKRLATWRDNDVVITDRDGNGVRTLTGVGRGLAFSADGTVLAVPGDGGWPRLIEIDGSREIGRVPPLKAHPASPTRKGPLAVSCIAFSPDGRTLALGCTDGSVRLGMWR